jgi:hypothetical protein
LILHSNRYDDVHSIIDIKKKEETQHRMSYPDTETSEEIGESVARSLHAINPTRCSLKECAKRVHRKTTSLCQRLYTLFTTHPHEQKMSYVGHAAQALRRAIIMGKGAVGLCIHSAFPFLCEKTGTKVVEQLYEEIHPKKRELN